MAGIRHCAAWILACLILFALTAPATGMAEQKDLTAEIQKQYQTIQSFRTEFTQELVNAASNASETRKGWIVYERPRRIHWETRIPEKEILILNRDYVWDYYPEEGVAYRYSLKQMFDSKTMLRFISGDVNLSQEFTVERLDSDSGNEDLIRLKLLPRNPDPGLVEAELSVEPDSMLIKRIKLVDFFGNKNILRFQDIQRNYNPDPNLFVLEPPEDTRVVDKAKDVSQEIR